MANTTSSKVIVQTLYPKVKKALSNKATKTQFKINLDKYLKDNIDSFSGTGPTTRPIFGRTNEDALVQLVGLTNEEIKATLKSMKGNDPAWKNFNTPFNIAIVLAIRYFDETKDETYLNTGLLYIAVHIYCYKFTVYFQYEPNQAAMAYTIAHMSNRFKIKKTTTLLGSLMETMQTCYAAHRTRLNSGEDIAALKFINDATTRINSFLKVICREYMKTMKDGNYLQTEHESFDDETYYEADSDSYAIDRIANKIMTNLIVHGPDRRLIKLAAQNSSVSVNTLQTCILTIVSSTNEKDLRHLIECLLSLYLRNNPDKTASISDIGTNKFLLYCIRLYKSSNTGNKDIITIKCILDEWIDQPEIKNRVETKNSLGNYRKAVFLFFIYTIEKLC